MRRRTPIIWVLLVFGSLLGPNRVAAQSAVTSQEYADQLYRDGLRAYQAGAEGQVREALSLWRQAAAIYERLGRSDDLSRVLRDMASAYNTLGVTDSVYGLNARADSASILSRRATDRVGKRTGFGIGATVGTQSYSGAQNASITPGWSVDAFVRYQHRWGVQVVGAVEYGGHTIQGTTLGYTSIRPYGEARFVVPSLGRHVAPYVGVRTGPVWESAVEPGVVFRSRGWSFGGSGGLFVRIAEQVALEAGVAGGVTSFGDFDFDGAANWAGCASRERALQTPLPATAATCYPEAAKAGVLIPGTPGGVLTGSGDRQRIVHEGSARRAPWVRARIGLHLVLSGR